MKEMQMWTGRKKDKNVVDKVSGAPQCKCSRRARAVNFRPGNHSNKRLLRAEFGSRNGPSILRPVAGFAGNLQSRPHAWITGSSQIRTALGANGVNKYSHWTFVKFTSSRGPMQTNMEVKDEAGHLIRSAHHSRKGTRPSERPSNQTDIYYRPELDALRFIACILVLIHHLPLGRPVFNTTKQAGSFGLPIFFCLSAYLIITLLLKEKDRTGTVQVRWFAIRRILRIWPLYFGILAIGWVLGRLWPVIHLSGKEIAFFALMLGNVWMARHGWSGSPSAVVWSVSIEEQFYLGIPLLIRTGGRRAIIICCSVALVVAYIALAWVHLRREDPAVAPWSNSFVQFQYFAAGGFLALIYERWKIRLSIWARVFLFGISLSAFGIAGPILVTNSGATLAVAYLLGLVGTCGILVATLYSPLAPPSLLVYLGRISYGFYVFHTTILWFVFGSAFPRIQSYMLLHRYQGTLLAVLLTTFCASVSYRFIERPILRLKDRFAVIHSSPEGSKISRAAIRQSESF